MHSIARRIVVALASVLVVVLLFGLMANRWNTRVRAARLSLAEIASRYPVGSPERAMAIRREVTSRRHPRWSDLTMSEIAARMETIAMHTLVRPRDVTPGGATQTIAPFLGDFTALSAPSGQGFFMIRQNDCSLTYNAGTFSRSLTNPGYTVNTTVPHYDQTIHQLGGMTTKGGAFPAGCVPINGSATRALFLGKTSQNLYVFASEGYDGTTRNNALYYGTIDSAYNYHSLSVDDSNPNIHAIASGDLNKDGNGDIIELGFGNCSINVLLGKSDGTFQAGVAYPCSGQGSEGAVVADFNGDGKPDVAVISQDGMITMLLGNGDGTLHQGQTLHIANSRAAAFGGNLIAADTRGMGRNDIIASTGDLLLSNGDGTFTAGTSISFPSVGATSEFGPNLAAADLNKDGKLDLVYSDGYSIDIYLGKGDGTYTPGLRYATIDNVGYVTIADLDGDGNLDIYSGLAGAQFYGGGDQFEMDESYVLLGNGDGTFQGAPTSATAYNGQNLADINGDGKLDLVGEAPSTDYLSSNFTTYLGRKDGSFAPTGIVLNVATINVPNVTEGATSYSNIGISGYAVADVNADGHADLLFIPNVLTSYYQRSILCVSFGRSDGSFAQPLCSELPSLLSNPGTLPTGGPDFDFNLIATSLQVKDLNGDGKPDILYNYQDSDYGTASYTAGYVVQPGNGDGTFGKPQVLELYSNANAPTTQVPRFSLLADVNRDGRPDLITTLQSGTYPNFTITAYLNLNNGDGTFKPATTLQLGVNSTNILVADMNGDGKPDLILEGTDSTNTTDIAISLGNGDGTFAKPLLTALLDTVSNGLAVGDFNGDGKMDVASLSYNNNYSGIYFGNGDGTLKTITDIYSEVLPDEHIPLNVQGPAIALDFDGDGKIDLLAGDVLLHTITAPSTTTPTLTATTTALSASSTSIATGQSVTLTATVSGPAGTTPVPTGTVTFLDGSTTLGTGTLDSTGKATFSTSSLTAGTHTITASYGGDTSFATSVSIAATITVTTPTAPSFTLSLSPSSGTISGAGGTLTSTVSITPSNGFNAATSLACSNLPAHTTCTLSPNSVTPNGASATATLTFTTAVASAAVDTPQFPGSSPQHRSMEITLAGLSLFAGILLLGRHRRLLLPRLLPVALLAAGALWLTSCSGHSSSSRTPSGTNSVTVTATSGASSQSAVFLLTVQ